MQPADEKKRKTSPILIPHLAAIFWFSVSPFVDKIGWQDSFGRLGSTRFET
jgi:hypothetical protein